MGHGQGQRRMLLFLPSLSQVLSLSLMVSMVAVSAVYMCVRH